MPINEKGEFVRESDSARSTVRTTSPMTPQAHDISHASPSFGHSLALFFLKSIFAIILFSLLYWSYNVIQKWLSNLVISSQHQPVNIERITSIRPASTGIVTEHALGIWRGAFSGKSAVLNIKSRLHNKFHGTLQCGNDLISIAGSLPGSGGFDFQEIKILSTPSHWTLGYNRGEYEASNRISGKGSDPINPPYTWFFVRDSESSNSDHKSPTTDTRLSEDELRTKTKSQLDIMRNEIFGRHGLKFSTPALANTFEGKVWYHPDTTNQDEVWQRLSNSERYNAALIRKFELEHGMLGASGSMREPLAENRIVEFQIQPEWSGAKPSTWHRLSSGNWIESYSDLPSNAFTYEREDRVHDEDGSIMIRSGGTEVFVPRAEGKTLYFRSSGNGVWTKLADMQNCRKGN